MKMDEILNSDASSSGAVAVPFCRDLSAALNLVSPGWAERVGGQFEHLENYIPSARDFAKALGVSERTLRRRLKAVGTSYSAILQQVRSDRARMALTHSDLSVSEIATALGYSETGNFRHAFRRWMGCAPNELRQAIDGSQTLRARIPRGRGRVAP